MKGEAKHASVLLRAGARPAGAGAECAVLLNLMKMKDAFYWESKLRSLLFHLHKNSYRIIPRSLNSWRGPRSAVRGFLSWRLRRTGPGAR